FFRRRVFLEDKADITHARTQIGKLPRLHAGALEVKRGGKISASGSRALCQQRTNKQLPENRATRPAGTKHMPSSPYFTAKKKSSLPGNDPYENGCWRRLVLA